MIIRWLTGAQAGTVETVEQHIGEAFVWNGSAEIACPQPPAPVEIIDAPEPPPPPVEMPFTEAEAASPV